MAFEQDETEMTTDETLTEDTGMAEENETFYSQMPTEADETPAADADMSTDEMREDSTQEDRAT